MRLRFSDAGHLKGNLEFDDAFHELSEDLQQTTLQIAEEKFAKQEMEDGDVKERIRAFANEQNVALDENVISTISDLFIANSSIVN